MGSTIKYVAFFTRGFAFVGILCFADLMGEVNLHRLRLNKDSAVMLDENIKLGLRIRDMMLLTNGHLV